MVLGDYDAAITAGELRELLDGVDDNARVCVGVGVPYRYVEGADMSPLEDHDTGFTEQAVTLHAGWG